MNNFNYIQDGTRLFCSANSGDDRNDGLTPDTPVKTLTKLNSISKVHLKYNFILQGHFINELIGSIAVNNYYYGDGKTVIEYTDDYISTALTGTFTINFNNITFIGNKKTNLVTTTAIIFQKSTVKNLYCNLVNSIYFSKIIGCYLPAISSNSNNQRNSLFFNSYIGVSQFALTNCLNNYFNEGCFLLIFTTPTVSTCPNNNIRCQIKINNTGVTYENLAAAKVAYPTSFVGSINADPQFKNIALGDFSVATGSPMIRAGEYNVNIGNVKESTSIYFNDYNLLWTAGTYALGAKVFYIISNITYLYESLVDSNTETPSNVSTANWKIVATLDDTLDFNNGDIIIKTGESLGIITLNKYLDATGARKFLASTYLGKSMFSITGNNQPVKDSITNRVYSTYSTWSNATTYNTGDKIQYNLGTTYGVRVFSSKVDTNLNHIPTYGGDTYWDMINPEFIEDNAGNNPNRLNIEFRSGITEIELEADTWKIHDISKEIKVWNNLGDGDYAFDLDEGNPVNDMIGYIRKRFFQFRITLRNI